MEKVRKSETDKQTALNCFIRGLTAAEIEKVTGIPRRTLEGYSMRENWKGKRDDKGKAEKLKMFKEFRKAVESKRRERSEAHRIDLDRSMFEEMEKAYKL